MAYILPMFDLVHQDAVRDFLKLVRISPKRPTLAFLGELSRAFLRLPYENLTKIIRMHEQPDATRRLRLPDIVVGDHIEKGTGGTCFSLTYLFEQVLTYCGYSCRPVLCDRSYGEDTHCALITCVGDAEYVVDPGYLLERPLLLPRRGVTNSATAGGNVRLERLGDTSQYLLSTTTAGRSVIRYRLKNRPVTEELFYQRWCDSFSWAQMRHVCVTRLEAGGRIYMRDNHLRYATSDRKAHEKIKRDYEQVVAATFGIDRNVIEQARQYVCTP